MTKKRDIAADAEAALLEMAEDFRGTGLMTEGTYQKITMRQLDKTEAVTAAPLTGDEIRAMREAAHLSQAAFASRLNLTTGYVSQLERGAKKPKGAALAALNMIRHHGIALTLKPKASRANEPEPA